MFHLFVALRSNATTTVALVFDAAVTLGLEINAVVTAAAPEITRLSQLR